jgi:putative membrane-bound dehydrogenase-like protein
MASNRSYVRRIVLYVCASLFGIAIVGPSPARAAGLSPAAALKRFRVPPGFQVKLFASEPVIKQPVAMQFDRRGRMWVIQYLQYPNPAGLKVVKVDNYLRTVYDRVPEPPPRGPQGADRITILEDVDGDGHADKSKDFLDGLNLTTGLALGHGGVFVVQSPYLLFYADKNQDDLPDGDPEVLLTGFGMEDSHALANSLQWGPDGWLYGTQGSTVTAHIRGITFQQGIWRYHPITKKFELFAEGGGNTWGNDFDRHGNTIAGTNYGGVAMLHQVQGAYYTKNFGKHGALQNPYAFGYFEHVPHQNFKGGHVTIGGIVYQADTYPPQYRNQYIAANVLSNAIYWHHIDPVGSSFRNRFGGDLMTTDDQWFRPVDCAMGPDGSMFFADWYDQRANHVDPKDDWDKTNGRIYKLEYQGTRSVAGLDLNIKTSEELVGLLRDRNDWYVRQARSILAERCDTSITPQLRSNIFESDQPQLALESLWAWYVTAGLDKKIVRDLLDHPCADVRAWTIRLLGDENSIASEFRRHIGSLAANDPSSAVRSQLACTCKRLPGSQALPLVSELLPRDEDADDPYIPLLLWWAIESKAETDREAVLRLLASSDTWAKAIPHQFIIERLARRYASTGSEQDFQSCAKLLAMAPTASDTELVVRGLEKGLEGRRLPAVPAPLEKPLDKLLAVERPSPSVIRLAVRLGSSAAIDRALLMAEDTSLPLSDRLAIIELEGQVGEPSCVPVLLGLLNDGKQPAAIRKAALAGLARFNDPQIPVQTLAAFAKLPAGLRGPALSLLCGRKTWAMSLLEEVDHGRIAEKDISSDYLRQIALHQDQSLNALVEKHWGKVEQETPADKRARIHGINVSMKLAPGDPVRGHELFKKTCASCHTLFGEGNKIGPELTGADRKNNEFLLSNIIDPSAVIRKEFFQYTAVLKDGRVLSGLIAESTPATVTLLDAKNQRTVIPQTDIEDLSRSPLSLMPERILDPLDAQEIRDLMSYLRSDGPKSPQAAN